MNLHELNNLADDPGSVSWSIKSLALAVIMAIILLLGYKLIIVDELSRTRRGRSQGTRTAHRL